MTRIELLIIIIKQEFTIQYRVYNTIIRHMINTLQYSGHILHSILAYIGYTNWYSSTAINIVIVVVVINVYVVNVSISISLCTQRFGMCWFHECTSIAKSQGSLSTEWHLAENAHIASSPTSRRTNCLFARWARRDMHRECFSSFQQNSFTCATCRCHSTVVRAIVSTWRHKSTCIRVYLITN